MTSRIFQSISWEIVLLYPSHHISKLLKNQTQLPQIIIIAAHINVDLRDSDNRRSQLRTCNWRWNYHWIRCRGRWGNHPWARTIAGRRCDRAIGARPCFPRRWPRRLRRRSSGRRSSASAWLLRWGSARPGHDGVGTVLRAPPRRRVTSWIRGALFCIVGCKKEIMS